MFSRLKGLGDALRAPDQTLAKLNQHGSVLYFRSLVNGGREPRVIRLGFGQNLSVQISAEPTKKVMDEEGNEGGAINIIDDDDPQELDRVGLLVMLNLHAEQDDLETRAAEQFTKEDGKLLSAKNVEDVLKRILRPQKGAAGEQSLKEIANGKGHHQQQGRGDRTLLANALLELFESQSGTVLIDRSHPIKAAQQQSFIRIVLEAMEDTEMSLSRAFRYSPSYLTFGRPVGVTEESLSEAKESISRKVLENFYGKLSQADYMMDDQLREKLYPQLLSFVRSGVYQSQREGFRSTVNKNLSLFLHGTPGIGKSTFVQVFASSLQRALREQLSPQVEVCIVKIPLNAYLNAWNLNQILQIQGISDWSVERMMEQALTKGHLVVLHLEECPQSAELQDSLFHCLQKMLERKLWFRYPEYKSNVLFVFTSNYGPSDLVRGFCTEYCTLRPPTEQMQKQWLKRKLEASLSSALTRRGKTATTVQVDIAPNAFPQTTADIRPLNAWWISLSYALARRFPLKGLLENDANGHGQPRQFNAFVRSKDGSKLQIGWADDKAAEAVDVVTSDGFFFYDCSASKASQEAMDPKTRTILGMCLSGDLTPAVIVLRGTKAWQEQMEHSLSQGVQSMITRKETTSFVSTKIELLDPEDESKVLGEPGEIRGGLFKFIDDATNPNSTFKQKRGVNKKARLTEGEQEEEDICLVCARVNEIGSTFLRELLETGDKSRTHRLGIFKRGLLFVVSLAEGAELTPQLESRAHQILCE